ncbi:MAG: hypothetical protein KGY70_11470 [Bacteroidales bacterium]|nr:hypothetical protein [Bacteroidales bacterium]
MGDACNATGNQDIGHLIRSFSILTLLLLPYLIGGISPAVYFASYILLRYILFDFIYNVTAGADLFYHSERNWYGQLMSKVQPGFEVFSKSICLVAVVAVILNNI